MNDESKHERIHSSCDDKHERFCDRLADVLGDESVRSFALRANLSPPVIKKYLEGESTPNVERLCAIADAGFVTVQWLATGEGPKFPNHELPISDSREAEALPHSTSDFSTFADEYALIPGYSVQVSAGNGTLAQDSKPVRHLAFRRKWLKWRGFCEKDLAIVWAKGDSMEPVISDNNTLVVHLGRTKPVDGGIYVIRNGDQLWVKRVQVKPGAWLLLSDNAVYPPFEVPMSEQHNFQVVGQVVHISKDIGN